MIITSTYNDLRDYIEHSDDIGECRIVNGAHWDLEIGRICELSLSRPNPPLVVFDNIPGYPAGYRVAVNLLESRRRMALALGLPDNLSPVQLTRAWRERIRSGIELIPPQLVPDGPVRQNILLGDDIDLLRFPTPKWHEHDGGRYIGTADMVIMKDPDTGWVNLGTYRVSVHDHNTAGMYILEGHHGDLIARKYWERGQSCPVAIVCGGDPALYYASSVGVAAGTSEYDYAGGIKGEAIEVITGETTDLPIPARAEIVIEGQYLSPDEAMIPEGPLGEWMGYYASGQEMRPPVQVTSIMHRDDPIIGGAPPFVGNADPGLCSTLTMAADLWDFLDGQVPGIQGVSYLFRRNLMVVISLKQQYPGHAKQALQLAGNTYRGGPAAVNARFIIAVDEDIDPSNINEVLWALCTRCDPVTSIDIVGERWTMRSDPMVSDEDRARGNIVASTAFISACRPFHRLGSFPRTTATPPDAMAETAARWEHVLFGDD